MAERSPLGKHSPYQFRWENSKMDSVSGVGGGPPWAHYASTNTVESFSNYASTNTVEESPDWPPCRLCGQSDGPRANLAEFPRSRSGVSERQQRS